MKSIFSKAFLILFLANFYIAQAELIITSYSLNFTKYPIISGSLTVTKDGAAAQEIKAVFVEGTSPVVPNVFESIGNGQFRFEFLTSTYNFDPIIDGLRYSNFVVAYDNEETAYRNATEILTQTPRIFVTDYENKFISDIRFGNIAAGDTGAYQIRIGGYFNQFDGTAPMIADSITTESDLFRLRWLGPDGNPNLFNGFPTLINPLDRYWINIYYQPIESDQYVHDIVTIHFNGGNKFKIPIYAGSNTITSDPVMEILTPTSGEILTPCENYLIKWKGHNKDAPVRILFSDDNGSTWEQIAAVQDSMYNWTVPSSISQNARIRLIQDVFQSDRVAMKNTDDAVYDVNFNEFGTELLSVNQLGEIAEWDLFAGSEPIVINKYQMQNPLVSKFERLKVTYTDGKGFIAGAYYSTSEAKSYVNIFESGNSDQIATFISPSNYIISELETDVKSQYIALIPDYNAKLILLDPKSGQLQREIDFEYPILKAEFNNKLEQLAVVLLNGDFLILNSNDFSVIKKFQILNFQLITALDFSNNGKMLALALQSTGSNLTLNFTVDIETGFVTRVFKQAATNTTQMRFAPSSGSLIIGTEIGTPQMVLYDLTLSTQNEGLAGHYGTLTDLDISSDGHALVSSSVTRDNLYLRKFAFPEDITSDSFIIQPALLSNNSISLEPAYIGTEQNVLVNTVCNIGETFIDINEVFFQKGRNFRLLNQFSRDTLLPGECTNLEIVYMPLDTGRVSDSLAFRVCGVDILVPIIGEGLPRNITFSQSIVDFGEVCIGDTLVIEDFEIINNDPAPLIINKLSLNSDRFIFAPWIQDEVIPAKSSLKIDLMFIPKEIGEFKAQLGVNHSNQTNLISFLNLEGTGIGADISVSHERLLFIPEILQRELTITNNTNISVNITGLISIPDGYFQNISNLPVTLEAKGSQTFSIVWNGENPNQVVRLKIEADPCVIQKYLEIDLYSGSSTVFVNDTIVGPLDDAGIRISYQNKENGEYNGFRTFEGLITMNPRLFLPFEIEVPGGEGELTSNEVIDGLRYIGFRVKNNFVKSGDLAVIKGIPGLAETKTTTVFLIKEALDFGEAVSTSYGYGTFSIDDGCEDRLIIRDTKALQILSVSPNPAEEIVKIDVQSEISGNGYLHIYDYLGQRALTAGPYQIIKGNNSINVNIISLHPGNYKITLQIEAEMTQESLLIMR